MYNWLKFSYLLIAVCMLLSCKKDHPVYQNKTRKIKYVVNGTNFRLNFIDSLSAFNADKVFRDVFSYEFRKGTGANIGMSVYRQSSSDTIYSWAIYIDDKLYANAFSEGGAYMMVPY